MKATTLVRHLVFPTLCLAAAGCITNTANVWIKVKDPSGAPVPTAKVTLSCPEDRWRPYAAQDPGTFRFISSWLFDRECKVTVEEAPYQTKTILLGDVCGTSGDDRDEISCPVDVRFDVQLAPIAID